MSRIMLQNVAKKLGKTLVFSNINLEFEPGKLIVFVGPSGCGKST
jgi:ABC-type sugar transport system ATPase subunit